MGEGVFNFVQVEGVLYCRGEIIVLISGFYVKNVGKFLYSFILVYNRFVVFKDSLLFLLLLYIFIYELYL